MTIRETSSADGTAIVYRAIGPAAARPLVLLHGWAQSLQCWGDEVLGPLAHSYRVIAVDLRGHGYSDAPERGYDDPVVWADDVSAVLAAEGISAGAILLGWSYGGMVICDYLAERGSGAVGGVVFVSAITGIGRGQAGGRIGKAMRAALPGAYSESPGTAVRAFREFGAANTGPEEDRGTAAQRIFGVSLATAQRVREALFARAGGHDDLLRALDIPALVLHGTADPVVDISAAQHAEQLIPGAKASYWEGAQHGLFIEDPARFVSEITAFVDGLA